jgi:hypothetical protein
MGLPALTNGLGVIVVASAGRAIFIPPDIIKNNADLLSLGNNFQFLPAGTIGNQLKTIRFKMDIDPPGFQLNVEAGDSFTSIVRDDLSDLDLFRFLVYGDVSQ